MRSIVPKRTEKQKQKRNQILLGAILVFVMMLSTFGLVVNSFGAENSNKITYKGYTFVSSNGLWKSTIGSYDFTFSFLPTETQENVSIEINNLSKTFSSYQAEPLYIYSEDSYSTNEIYRILGPLVTRVQLACESAENCRGDYPIKDCSENFIIIKNSEVNPSISQNQSCIYIQGNYQSLLKTTDEFLFRIFGIKN